MGDLMAVVAAAVVVIGVAVVVLLCLPDRLFHEVSIDGTQKILWDSSSRAGDVRLTCCI